VIVRPENCDDWLDPETSEAKLKDIVEHPQNDELTVYEVSPVVNNARNERAECIAPVARPNLLNQHGEQQ
jgi:putative SOS response-associated peptidase YedK